jgi:hypothetical protein
VVGQDYYRSFTSSLPTSRIRLSMLVGFFCETHLPDTGSLAIAVTVQCYTGKLTDQNDKYFSRSDRWSGDGC